MKKTDYQKPTCEILVIRFEENIMSPNGTWSKSIKEGSTWDTTDEDYGLE